MDILQLSANILGSGVATAGVGAWFASRFNRRIEEQKAVLQRASRVHERQVDALSELYAALRQAHDYLQLATKSAIFAGENPDEYPKRFMNAVRAAYEKFVAIRLLLPIAVVTHADAFFAKAQEGHTNFGFARYNEILPEQRAAAWDRAKTIAYDELPKLLASLESSAREVVHGVAGTPSFKVVARAS